MNNADARREDARRVDGKFGEQALGQPTDATLPTADTEDGRRLLALNWVNEEALRYEDLTGASTGFLSEMNAVTDLNSSMMFGLNPDMAAGRLDDPELVLGDAWRYSSSHEKRAEMLAGLNTVKERFVEFLDQNDLHEPPKPMIENPTVHEFTSSEEAYSETQWRDDIKDGDLLVVKHSDGSKTIGFLCEAWPVAVHGPQGGLHAFGKTREAFLAEKPEYTHVIAEVDRLHG